MSSGRATAPMAIQIDFIPIADPSMKKKLITDD